MKLQLIIFHFFVCLFWLVVFALFTCLFVSFVCLFFSTISQLLVSRDATKNSN